MEINRSGILFVISAPSGGGKSTILKRLLADDPHLGYSVSTTTRPMREGEIDGKSYFFVSEEQFNKMVSDSRFLEWAVVHKRLYGTRKDLIEGMLNEGKDIGFDIDFQGGLNVKKQIPESVLIFILPPSMKILEERLRGRKSDSDDVIELRLKNAIEEIAHANQYDYIVVNDELEKTVDSVKAIIEAERHRASRLKISKITN